MLQFFRNGLTSYFATALLGLLIASFALWGIGGDILGGAGSKVAEIGDDKLTLNEYAREFQNKFSEIQQQSNGEVTREMVIDQGLSRKWVTDLVQSKAFAHAAHSLGIRVTDAQLREFIISVESFQDTLGEFSIATFESLAGYRGYTSGEFEEILRKDLERQYLMASLISAVTVPDAVEKSFIKFLREERTAEILTIPAFSIANVPEPSEADLKQYYDRNRANYMAPEYRDIRFITLSIKDFVGDITVTDAEIDDAMGAAAKASVENEKRDFEQLLFDDKEAADKAYADLKAGKTFDEIIAATGSTIEDATVVGNTHEDALDSYGSEAADNIFSANQGTYTAPVETDFGWRIFNITKVSAPTATKADLRQEAEEHLKTEKAIDLLYTKSELINDELAAGGSLSDIAANLNLKLNVALNIDAKGYNSKGDLLPNIPSDPIFLASAFETLEGDEPLLEEMGDGEYFLVVVDNITEVALRPFEEVKTSVHDMWMADTRKKLAREQANEILTKAQDGEPLADLSAKDGSMGYTSVTLARNDQTGKVTRALHDSIFQLDIGRARIMPAADGNGFVIVKLVSRNHPDTPMPPAQSAQLKQLLAQEYQQRILSNYWRYLETSLPVIINERAVNAVHNQLDSREQ
ncbi:MAG: SurA N-terminal domain-containing protein [Emcibacter sp.]|nr:SurA N-terminal domain-containing protein [Emcibacter sp.]